MKSVTKKKAYKKPVKKALVKEDIAGPPIPTSVPDLNTALFNSERARVWAETMTSKDSRIWLIIGQAQSGENFMVHDQTASLSKVADALEEIVKSIRQNLN